MPPALRLGYNTVAPITRSAPSLGQAPKYNGSAMRRSPTALACLAVSLLGVPRPAGGQVFEPEVAAIEFQGNAFLRAPELAAAIVTSRTACKSVLLTPLCWVGLDAAREDHTLSSRELLVDAARIRILYAQRGFRNAVVESEVDYPEAPDSTKVAVVFHIQENDPVVISSLTFQGLDEQHDQILDDLTSRVGGRLDGYDLIADRDSILARLQERGYAHADIFREIFIPSSSPLTAEVTFDIYAGPRSEFGAVEIQSAGPDEEHGATFDERTLERAVGIREGQVYRKSRVEKARQDLYSLDLVRFATVDEDLENDPDSVVPIRVTVTEGDLRRVRTSLGVSTADCLNGEGRWTSRNFFGGARRVQLRAGLSNVLADRLNTSPICSQTGSDEFAKLNWQLAAEFTQPFVFGSRTSFQANTFVERQSVQDVFIRQAVGAGAAVTRDIGQDQIVSFSYRPEVARLEAAEFLFCTNFLVCDLADIVVLQGNNWLTPFGFTYTRSRVDQLLDPSSGFSVLLDAEYASSWTGSDFGYRRWQGEFAWYRQLNERVVFATRVRGGGVTPSEFRGRASAESGLRIIHPQKRFYAGGGSTIRGFTENQLGPRVLAVPLSSLVTSTNPADTPVCTPQEVQLLTCDASSLRAGLFSPRPTGGSLVAIANAELRMDLGDSPLQGAVFVDVGQVWEDTGEFSLGQLEPTPGVGVRYLSPIGPIRVDVGYRVAEAIPLPVVTRQIRRFDPQRDLGLPTLEVGGVSYIESDELALLRPRVLFGSADRWSLDRFQFHLSIGQAF